MQHDVVNQRLTKIRELFAQMEACWEREYSLKMELQQTIELSPEFVAILQAKELYEPVIRRVANYSQHIKLGKGSFARALCDIGDNIRRKELKSG